ncbi:hypothetical protein TKK_0008518 [Trichogramma kaykai]
MEAEVNNHYVALLDLIKVMLLSLKSDQDRRTTFCCYMFIALEPDFPNRIVSHIINNTSIFPTVEDTNFFVKFGLKFHSLKIMRYLQEARLNIHKVIFNDGRSPLHYLYELNESWDRNKFNSCGTMELIEFFVKDSHKNYIDKHGYTYFHAACMVGDGETVRSFVSQGVDLNLDTWKFSPLHIAAQYRRKEIVEILLENGANPNQLDHERSTPLHALVRLCLCECGSAFNFCDYKRSVDEIVSTLMNKGANIEARNRDGNTPLQLAVSRFDVDLTASLLEHGANLDSLNVDKIFNENFKPIELKNYPLTLNIIEVIKLLQSAGYILDIKTRLRMIKFWKIVRGNDIDHLIPHNNVWGGNWVKYIIVVDQLYFYERFGFFIKKEAADYLHKEKEKLKSRLVGEYKTLPEISNACEREVAKLNKIKLNNDISLYQICQMSYDKGYSILKNIKNWRIPSLDGLEHSYINLMVKRHIANILMRQQLELCAADFFMSDYCFLNMPYTVCRIFTEKMCDENLFRLLDQKNVESLMKSLPALQSKKPHVQDHAVLIIHEKDEENFSTPPVPKRRRLNDEEKS